MLLTCIKRCAIPRRRNGGDTAIFVIIAKGVPCLQLVAALMVADACIMVTLTTPTACCRAQRQVIRHCMHPGQQKPSHMAVYVSYQTSCTIQAHTLVHAYNILLLSCRTVCRQERMQEACIKSYQAILHSAVSAQLLLSLSGCAIRWPNN